jgi:hypothetical protein
VLVLVLVIVIVIEDIQENIDMRRHEKSIEKRKRLFDRSSIVCRIDYDYDYEHEHDGVGT